MTHSDQEMRTGLTAAVGAYLLWGIFPIFWRQIGSFDPLQVVGHRVLWSFAFLLLVLPLLIYFMQPQERLSLGRAVRQWRTWATYGLAASLVAANWLVFVWAVNNGRVLEASLGYYINPLLNVLLGVVVLGERLTQLQWTAIGCATLGVALLTIAGGGLPWVSLVLAFSFAAYSLVKKKAQLPALIGLLLETTTLAIPAMLFLALRESQGLGAFQMGDSRLLIFLVLGGTVTIMPLALFAFAARRAPLSAIGILQYIAPTLQFFVGIFVFAEPFDQNQLLGFACVWLAIILYVVSNRGRTSSSTKTQASMAAAGTARGE